MRAALLLLSLVALRPAGASAQSLLSAAGLGVPVESLDARARALGGLGLGVFGPSLLPSDPAAPADLRLPSVAFTLGGSWVDVDEGNGTLSDASGTRFPFLAASYPARSLGVLTVSYGSVLDQRWRTRVEHLVPLEETSARVTDTFFSDGGVAALRLGFASRIAPSLALGGAVGMYTGETTRRGSRSFDSVDVVVAIPDFQTEGTWRYSGFNATVGAIVDVAEVLRVAASLDWPGSLEAEPASSEVTESRSYHLPVTLRVGASGVLAPGLVVTVGASQADWSGTADDTGEATGRTARTFGGGLEFTRASLSGRDTPLRLGWRRSDLPFSLLGEEPSETVLAGGLGLNLVQVEDLPRARLDFSLERGRREAGSLSESFWRASMGLQVSGF